MVISHLSGGFGNQLYSYAFAYAVAKARKEELWIDTAIQDAPWFFRNPDILNLNIKYDKRVSYKIGEKKIDKIFNRINFRNAIGWNTKIINESDMPNIDDWFDTCVNQKGNIYIKGNWSYEKLFISVKQEIIDMFTFKNELSKEANDIAQDINSQETSVGIHYRLGDYVKIGIVINPDYFISAMTSMVEKYGNPVFYSFSEDNDWVKKQFEGLPYNIKYVEYSSDDKGLEDFRLYSMCKHQIASNSSYSWWGAYLNNNPNKYIIAPTDYNGGWKSEIYPKHWDVRPFEFLK